MVADFVELCRAARERPGPETSDRLWSAWFALPAWHFLAVSSPVGPLPYSSAIDGQRCVLAFTTAERARAYGASLHLAPMALSPVETIQRLAPLQRFGVTGFLVDIGPDGFLTALDTLWQLFHRLHKAASNATPSSRAPAPSAPEPEPVPAPPRPAPGTMAWFLELPVWHLAVTGADRSMPELATVGAELAAEVYSSAEAARLAGVRGPLAELAPPAVLSLLSELEVVKLVRFDGHLVVDHVELGVTRHT